MYFVLFPPLLFRALARAQLDLAASLPMLAAGLLFTACAFVLGSAAKPLFRYRRPVLPPATRARTALIPTSALP